MAQQTINVGAAANDRTGDPWREAMIKTNANFDELYLASIPLADKAAVLANGTLAAGVITLNVASYYIAGNIDLITDVIALPGGANILGNTVTLSSITTNSSSPTITCSAGGFAASAIIGFGGLKINNTGSGAAIRATGPTTILFTQNLFTSAAGNGLEIDGVAGFVSNSWTMTSGVTNGCVLTGTNPRTIFENFNPNGVTGIGIDIQGPMTGPLLLELPIILSVGIGVNCNQAINGIGITDGSITSSAGTAFRFSGSAVGAIRISGARIAATAGDALDISGSNTIGTLILEAANLQAGGGGNACLKTDSPSSGNIGLGADINITSFIAIAGATALINVSKKDVFFMFNNCLGNSASVRGEVSNSTVLGTLTLDAQATTTLAFQGDDGTITAFSDAGGGDTTVATAATPASGAPVAIFGTTSYNGLFVAANVVSNVSFDIVRAFVADDATGIWESGWVKISGSTTAGVNIERFQQSDDNELEYLGLAASVLMYGAGTAGQKSGATVNQYEFAVFSDDETGNGFVKINGSLTRDLTNRISSGYGRIPKIAIITEKFSAFVRNMDGSNDFICDGLTTDIVAA